MGIRNRQKDFLLNYVGGVQLCLATPEPELHFWNPWDLDWGWLDNCKFYLEEYSEQSTI